MPSIVELIAKKRDGGRLADDEIRWIINEFSADRLPDYQMSALAMAIFYRGLDDRETGAWTEAMLRSGLVLDLSALGSGRVDKHSTGGVGDKISLPLAPAAAAAGVIVPMVAGRGLGHTGGTIDKLEAIPGYDVALPAARFRATLAEVGCSIIGQTAEIAPADKRLYALRDVTGTVESIPLICASIMSKKLAEGIEGLVLDVKVGPGAFMKTLDAARELARRMVAVGRETGTRVVAFLTRMDEPLGRMVGNANEVVESLDVLDGGGPADIVELVTTLGGAMVELARGVTFEEGRQRIAATLADGSARARWDRMVRAHGGDPRRDALPAPTAETPIPAPRDGWVEAIDGREVGLVAMGLGAGRSRAGDVIDPAVGIRVDRKVGEKVTAGQPLATIQHGRRGAPDPAACARLGAAFALSSSPPPTPAMMDRPLVLERIG
ncbi:MAG: thymidine phosphorylase [Deltaproteobacteria bacterium]|nr:thymidine phosphorylase [Deltaproteobacteria bacterium]